MCSLNDQGTFNIKSAFGENMNKCQTISQWFDDNQIQVESHWLQA